MKKALIFLFCTLVVSGCRGCQKTDGELTRDKVQYNFSAAYSNEMDNVIFNTEIIVNEEVNNNGLYKTTAQSQKLNSEKAYDILFDGIEVEEIIEIEAEFGKEVQYIGVDEETLYIVRDHLNMSKAIFNYVLHSFNLEGEDYNADQYLTGEEFEFMGIDEAYRSIVEIGSGFDLDISGIYNCYSLDYKKLKENEYVTDNKGKEDKTKYKDKWTEDDNGYFFAIHQIQQGCVVQYPLAGIFKEVCDANAPVQVLYTQNGIGRLDIYELFTFRQSNELLVLKNFEEIADTIADKYNMILTDYKYEVTKAELFWRPVETENQSYEMVPAWEITIHETATEKILHMYINALTAEEML